MASGIVNKCSASQFRRQCGHVGSLPKKKLLKLQMNASTPVLVRCLIQLNALEGRGS